MKTLNDMSVLEKEGFSLFVSQITRTLSHINKKKYGSNGVPRRREERLRGERSHHRFISRFNRRVRVEVLALAKKE